MANVSYSSQKEIVFNFDSLDFLVDNLIVNNVFDKIMILRLQPIVDEIKKQEALKQRKAEYLFGDEKDKD